LGRVPSECEAGEVLAAYPEKMTVYGKTLAFSFENG
jgi:hypothetical protein